MVADPVRRQVWVSWRHQPCGVCTYQGLIRGFTLDSGGTLKPIDNGHFVAVPVPLQGMGGMEIQLGPPILPSPTPGHAGSMLAIVYGIPDANLGGFHKCPFGPPGDQTWFFTRSVDDGATWSAPVQVFHNPSYQFCLVSNSVFAFTRDFSFLYDAASRAFLFAGRDGSQKTVIMRSIDDGKTWAQTQAFGQGETMMPTLATDGAGNLGLTYYEAVGTTMLKLNFRWSRNSGIDWSPPLQVSPVFTPSVLSSNDARSLGDYEGLVGIPPGGVQFPAVKGNFIAAFTTSFDGVSQDVAVSGIQLPSR